MRRGVVRWWFPLALALLCLDAGRAGADEGGETSARTPTHDEAAATVKAAHAAGTAEPIRAIAADARLDPWIIADLLCHQGAHDAARALARAVPTPDGKALPAFVSTRKDAADDTAARKALAALEALVRGGEADVEAVRKAAEGVGSGNPLLAVRASAQVAVALSRAGQAKEAAEAFTASGDAARDLGWLVGAANRYREAGNHAARTGDYAGAAEGYRRWMLVEVARERVHDLARSRMSLAYALRKAGRGADALPVAEAALAGFEASKDEQRVAEATFDVGMIQKELAQNDEAMATLARALALHEKRGNRQGMAWCQLNLGGLHAIRGEQTRAIEYARLAEAGFTRTGPRWAAVMAQGNVGAALHARGDYTEAAEVFGAVYEAEKTLGRPGGMAWAISARGHVYFALGEHAKALACAQEAFALGRQVGDVGGEIASLLLRGSILGVVGEFERARTLHAQALALAEGPQHAFYRATALSFLGSDHLSLGEHDRALEYLEQAVEAHASLGMAGAHGQALGVMALVELDRGRYPEARARIEQALGVVGGDEPRPELVQLRITRAEIERRDGKPAKALALFDEALRSALELGAAENEIQARKGRARTLLVLGRPREAIEEVRAGARLLARMTGGLSEDQGASARGTVRELFDAGIAAAIALPDEEPTRVPTLLAMIEQGRAGVLLESLKNRRRLFASEVPAELKKARFRAEELAAAAQRAYRRAVRRRNLAAKREASKRWAEARAGVDDVVRRIRREVKGAGQLVHPEAVTLADLQGTLGKHEAFVLYAALPDRTHALVVRRDATSVHDLGDTAEIGDLCAAAVPSDSDRSVDAAVAALRARVVTALALPGGVTRVVVAAEGALARVPFGLLDTAREIAQSPSATVYRIVRDEPVARGRGILALGDPSYGSLRTHSDPRRSGHLARLAPLPETRKEVTAIRPSARLLGDDATEAALRAELDREGRWRAIHLACHGILDLDRPMRSALALTRAGSDDGFLTVQEIFELPMPADLVVLSACETGLGKVIRGEGVIGLPRAVLYAGGRRVLCSLWKVDDAATRALMTKFYALWNPAEGEGLGAAAALKAAQAHVRSQPQWKHPYYWSAWALWGLPD